MSGARLSPRHANTVAEPVAVEGAGSIVLLALRIALMGCAVALVGVLLHVAWKIVAA